MSIQILASSAKNLILLDLGMCVAFPTIVIPSIQNAAGPLSFDNEETSWFGSISLLCQPVGSVISGVLLERLGRKRSLLLVNIPPIVAWLLFYFAQSKDTMFAAGAIMGFGMGFMEAPIVTYVAEISQPEIRGVLTSYAGEFSCEICIQIGFFVEFLFGSVTDWKMAAAISTGVPLVTILAITLDKMCYNTSSNECFFLGRYIPGQDIRDLLSHTLYYVILQVPESPIWLVSQGRVIDAERSLCWLRGWVKPAAVQEELSELLRYNDERTCRIKGRGSSPELVSHVNRGFVGSDEELKLKQNGTQEEKLTEAKGKNSVVDWQRVRNIELAFTLLLNVSDGKYVNPHHCIINRPHGVVISETGSEPKGSRLDSRLAPWDTHDPERGTKDFSLKYKLRQMIKMTTLRPFILVNVFFFASNANGITGTRAYMVQVVSALIGFFGCLLCMVSVFWVGKRPLSLVSVGGSAAASILLGVYAYAVLPDAGSEGPRISTDNGASSSWIPMALFVALSFTHSFGSMPIPWMLLSEVFPFSTRSLATGLSAAFCYLMAFMFSKTFINLKESLHLYGLFWLYGGLTLIAFIYLFVELKETEGKTLEDIENYYSGKKGGGKLITSSSKDTTPVKTLNMELKNGNGSSSIHFKPQEVYRGSLGKIGSATDIISPHENSELPPIPNNLKTSPDDQNKPSGCVKYVPNEEEDDDDDKRRSRTSFQETVEINANCESGRQTPVDCMSKDEDGDEPSSVLDERTPTPINPITTEDTDTPPLVADDVIKVKHDDPRHVTTIEINVNDPKISSVLRNEELTDKH
uniref:Major facilitator superfamily (MFS) profile domain-containing protein n=1 Tax=Timema genevievae TaxID=629358 RepID=A0A7R9PLA0_TIMGE|nr:unnamed protein product [Timema genevievae]